jgi:hypothetical protein
MEHYALITHPEGASSHLNIRHLLQQLDAEGKKIYINFSFFITVFLLLIFINLVRSVVLNAF